MNKVCLHLSGAGAKMGHNYDKYVFIAFKLIK